MSILTGLITDLLITLSCSIYISLQNRQKSGHPSDFNFQSILFSKIMTSFCQLGIMSIWKFNNFLWVCWFLAKNLNNFKHPWPKIKIESHINGDHWKKQNLYYSRNYCESCKHLELNFYHTLEEMQYQEETQPFLFKFREI